MYLFRTMMTTVGHLWSETRSFPQGLWALLVLSLRRKRIRRGKILIIDQRKTLWFPASPRDHGSSQCSAGSTDLIQFAYRNDWNQLPRKLQVCFYQNRLVKLFRRFRFDERYLPKYRNYSVSQQGPTWTRQTWAGRFVPLLVLELSYANVCWEKMHRERKALFISSI